MAGDGRHGRGDDAGAARRPPPDRLPTRVRRHPVDRGAGVPPSIVATRGRPGDRGGDRRRGCGTAAPGMRSPRSATARSASAGRSSSWSRRRCRPSPTGSCRSCSARSATSTRRSSPVGSSRSVMSVWPRRSLAVFGIGVALRDPRRRPLAIALGAIAVIGVVWALGPRTPVFTVAYDWLPGFDLARGSARWLDVTVVRRRVRRGVGRRRARPRRRATSTTRWWLLSVVAGVASPRGRPRARRGRGQRPPRSLDRGVVAGGGGRRDRRHPPRPASRRFRRRVAARRRCCSWSNCWRWLASR